MPINNNKIIVLRRYMNIFNRLKIRNKIIAIIVIQTALLIIFGIIGFNVSYSTYKKQLYMQVSQSVDLLADNVDNKLKRISDLSFELITDDALQNSLIEINNEDEVSSYKKFQSAAKLRTKLSQYNFTEKYIDSIGVIDLDNNQYLKGDNNTNIDANQINQIMNTPKIGDGNVIWINPLDNDKQIFAVRSIRRVNDFSFSNIGLIVIKIDKQKLIDSKSNYLTNNEFYFSVFSNKNIILEERTGVNLNPLQLGIQAYKGSFFKKINNKSYLVNYNTFKYTGWKFVYALPIQSVMLPISKIQIVIVCLYLIIFVVITYIVILLSRKIVKPLEKLMINLKESKSLWFDGADYTEYLANITFAHSTDKDEIRFLERDFKVLIDRINSLLKENYDEKIMTKEWQLKALQRQINPHFLYNTLDSIYWMAKINKQDKIATTIKSLGNLLRNSIYKSENIITVGEEIAILNDYIIIQRFRFQDRLKFNMNISESFWDYKIPNLSIQTIVENSISHALEVKTGDCNIEIFANYVNNGIRISVLDNGPGVDLEMLVKLQKMEIESKTEGIGMKNVDQRIKVIFGSQYGLFLESEQDKWFKVNIFIPCSKGVDKEV